MNSDSGELVVTRRMWKRLMPEGMKRHLRPLWKRLTSPKPFDYSAYVQTRTEVLKEVLSNAKALEDFALNNELPPQFGHGFDERLVEIPWLLARLPARGARLLDVGSTLNHEFLLTQGQLTCRDVTIATLEPEELCMWQRRISYVYCDARALPFRDTWFDEVVSISTLEHIGLDNTRFYSQRESYRENDRFSYLAALKEMWRVLRPGGRCLLTVPFGRAASYSWFQQFDGEMIDHFINELNPNRVAETYYRYIGGAWVLTTRNACADATSFHDEPGCGIGEVPRASGAVVAVELQKAN